MKFVIGVLLLVAAVALGCWLSLRVMLYGGLMAAVENLGVNNSAVWGVIRAVFFGLGAIPGYILGLIGLLFFE